MLRPSLLITHKEVHDPTHRYPRGPVARPRDYAPLRRRVGVNGDLLVIGEDDEPNLHTATFARVRSRQLIKHEPIVGSFCAALLSPLFDDGVVLAVFDSGEAFAVGVAC